MLANGLIFLIVISSVGLVVVSDCSVGNNGGHCAQRLNEIEVYHSLLRIEVKLLTKRGRNEQGKDVLEIEGVNGLKVTFIYD